MLIFYGNEPKFMQICVLVCLGISTVIAAVFDAPLLIKSLRDKKNQTICVATGVFICVKEDKSQSNQFTRYRTRSIYATISLFASDAGRRGLEAAKYLFVES